MFFSELEEIYEVVRGSQEEHQEGVTSPYYLLISQMLEDSSQEFCLQVVECAIRVLRGKIKAESESQ